MHYVAASHGSRWTRRGRRPRTGPNAPRSARFAPPSRHTAGRSLRLVPAWAGGALDSEARPIVAHGSDALLACALKHGRMRIGEGRGSGSSDRGEKGGVGQSVVSRLLAHSWIDRAIDFKAFDTHRSHGALLRYYAGYTEFLEPRRMEDLDRIVEALDATVEEIVVDPVAQTESNLEEWLVAGDVIPLLARRGYPL